MLTCKTSHQRWSAFFPSKMSPQYGYITLLPTLNEKIDVLFAPSSTPEYQPLTNKLDGAVLHRFPIA